MEASVVDLRRKMRAVLAAVDRGETVTITYRGKPKAKIVPVGEKPPRPRIPITEDPAFGMWKDREDTRDAQAYVREIRRPRYAR
jgi:prevent-host-death family protein